MQQKEWQVFTRAWLNALLGFQDGTFSMEQAYNIVEKSSEGVGTEIEQFACNVISEIGGFPESYEKKILLLRSEPTEDEVLNFINT